MLGWPLDEAKLRVAIASFSGVKRRLDFYVNTPKHIYMDDYAHHPNELRAAITSVREMFPAREADGCSSRTRTPGRAIFTREFAEALSLSDEVLLLPIYPAREEPIEGVAFRNAAAAGPVVRARANRKKDLTDAEIEEPGIAGDVRGGRYRPLLHADRRFIRRKNKNPIKRRIVETVAVITPNLLT